MRILTIGTVVLLGLSSTAIAQSTTSGGGNQGSGGSGAGSGGGSSQAGSSVGANGDASNAGITTGSLLGGFNNTGNTRGTNSNISPTNPFSAYYANPYAAGVNTGTASAFGSPVYGNSLSGGSAGSARGGANTSATRSGFGATGGSGGSSSYASRGTGGTGGSSGYGGSTSSGLGTTSGMGGGFSSLSNTGSTFGGSTGLGSTGLTNRGTAGIGSGAAGGALQSFAPSNVTGLKSGVLYATRVGFKVNMPAPAEMRSNLQDVVSRSSGIAAPAGVKVDFDSGVAVLRGTVADDDERRHAESLVRLSPGVHSVRNELTIKP